MEKIWQKHYQKGVPLEINVDPNTSLVKFIEECGSKFASNDAFTCMGKTITYEQLLKKTSQLGAYLTAQLGLGKGDRVAIMLPNVLQNPISILSVLRAGLVVVNVNPLYTARELEHQLKDSGAKAIIIIENFAHVLENVLPNTPIENVIVTSMGECLGTPKGQLVNFVVRKVKKMVPDFNIPKAVTFSKALKIGQNLPFHQHPVNLEDVAFLQYTGGTTGVSKGAMLSHKNICSNIEQAYAWLSDSIEIGKEIVITALPLYHIFALTANCFTFMKIGGRNILIPNPRDIPGFVKELKKYKFSTFTGVNTLFNALLNCDDFKALDFSSLKLTLGGGMAVQSATAIEWKEVTKVPLIQAYGLTETSPAACINPLDIKDFNASIGLPISSTEVSIRNDDNVEVPAGEPGEICIRGPQVMLGYWQRPKETAEVFTPDGWLRTGDVAKIDEKGYVFIVDRKKDMILVSGFNVYPNEIEDVVVSHAGILEAAAVGVPDPKSGEVVKIYAVKKDPKLTEEELLGYCRKNLTGYKVPKYIEFKEDLPKTNVGKILRRALRTGA